MLRNNSRCLFSLVLFGLLAESLVLECFTFYYGDTSRITFLNLTRLNVWVVNIKAGCCWTLFESLALKMYLDVLLKAVISKRHLHLQFTCPGDFIPILGRPCPLKPNRAVALEWTLDMLSTSDHLLLVVCFFFKAWVAINKQPGFSSKLHCFSFVVTIQALKILLGVRWSFDYKTDVGRTYTWIPGGWWGERHLRQQHHPWLVRHCR